MSRLTTALHRRVGRSRRHGGYTLGELLVSISVIGILAGVAVPGMNNIILDNRRASVTNDMVYSMQAARSEAVTRNQRVAVCASRNGTSCASKYFWSEGWIVFNDLDQDFTPDGDEEILYRLRGNESIEVTPLDFDNSFAYRPNGRFLTEDDDVSTGQFSFCDSRGGERARVLIVNTSGRPRLSETTRTGDVPSCD